MKKILFPFSGVTVGGSYVSASEIVAELKKTRKYKPIVALPYKFDNATLFSYLKDDIIYYDKNQFTDKLRNTKSLKNKLRAFLSYFKMLHSAIKIIKKEKPDLVHVNDDRSMIPWALAAKINKVPVIWHLRQIKVKNRIDFFRINLSNYIIYNSKSSRISFEKYLKNKPIKTKVIYNIIDTDRFKLAEKNIKSNKKENISIVYIGNLTKNKRIEWVIEAYLNLKKGNKNIKFLIVGIDHSDGEYLRCISKAQEQFNDQSLEYLGFRSDIPEILGRSDILILPSKSESFGRVLGEALAAKVPVVACNIHGIKEVVDNNVNGYLVDVNSYNDFEERIIDLINNKEKRIEMGNKGRQSMIDKFSKDIIMEQIFKVYEEVVEKK